MAKKPKGPWGMRALVWIFTIVFGVLVFWAVGFLLGDIRQIPGPDHEEIEKKHIESSLLERENALDAGISELTRDIANQEESQRLISERSLILQQTIDHHAVSNTSIYAL